MNLKHASTSSKIETQSKKDGSDKLMPLPLLRGLFIFSSLITLQRVASGSIHVWPGTLSKLAASSSVAPKGSSKKSSSFVSVCSLPSEDGSCFFLFCRHRPPSSNPSGFLSASAFHHMRRNRPLLAQPHFGECLVTSLGVLRVDFIVCLDTRAQRSEHFSSRCRRT